MLSLGVKGCSFDSKILPVEQSSVVITTARYSAGGDTILSASTAAQTALTWYLALSFPESGIRCHGMTSKADIVVDLRLRSVKIRIGSNLFKIDDLEIGRTTRILLSAFGRSVEGSAVGMIKLRWPEPYRQADMLATALSFFDACQEFSACHEHMEI